MPERMAAHRTGTALLLLLLAACTARRAVQPPLDHSGFLDDYSILRPGGSGELALVYRNPKADWTRYRAVLLEPVTLWRSGRESLTPVPEDDLRRLVSTFEDALRRQLGEGFPLVDGPGPGVMRIRLAITEARGSDRVLDVMRGRRTSMGAPPAGPVDPELKRFLGSAAIEGDIRDAQTGELLAAGVDRRRADSSPVDTWAEIERALNRWAERLCVRLEKRTGAPGVPR